MTSHIRFLFALLILGAPGLVFAQTLDDARQPQTWTHYHTVTNPSSHQFAVQQPSVTADRRSSRLWRLTLYGAESFTLTTCVGANRATETAGTWVADGGNATGQPALEVYTASDATSGTCRVNAVPGAVEHPLDVSNLALNTSTTSAISFGVSDFTGVLRVKLSAIETQ